MLTRDEWKGMGLKADMDGHAVIDGILHVYEPEDGCLYPLEAIPVVETMNANVEGDDVVIVKKKAKKK